MKKEEKFAIEPIVEFDAVGEDELSSLLGGANPSSCSMNQPGCIVKCPDFCILSIS